MPEKSSGVMPDPTSSKSIDNPDSSVFVRSSIERVVGIPFAENNQIRLLRSGEEIFHAIFESIRKAGEIICIEFYIFKNDNTGNKLAELLKEKAKQGVKVYILYDHFGSFLTPGIFWSLLKKSGINLKASHPFNWLAPRHYFHRNHKKLLVIDGHKAFTGGFNIADEYHRYLRKWKQPWRDTGIYLEGPIALTLFDMFKKSWIAWKGKPITFHEKTLPEKPGVPVIPVFTDSSRARKKFRLLLLYSINSARKNIYITNAYFAPSKWVLSALENAVGRGVDVKLLLPGKSDIAPVYYAGRYFYKRLLKAGVEIYNFQDRILHAKTAIFDSCWSIIGSANLDFQSLRRNDEGNAGILSHEFGMQITGSFLDDLKQSIKIDLDTWSKRPIYEKILEKFFSFFRKRL